MFLYFYRLRTKRRHRNVAEIKTGMDYIQHAEIQWESFTAHIPDTRQVLQAAANKFIGLEKTECKTIGHESIALLPCCRGLSVKRGILNSSKCYDALFQPDVMRPTPLHSTIGRSYKKSNPWEMAACRRPKTGTVAVTGNRVKLLALVCDLILHVFIICSRLITEKLRRASATSPFGRSGAIVFQWILVRRTLKDPRNHISFGWNA